MKEQPNYIIRSLFIFSTLFLFCTSGLTGGMATGGKKGLTKKTGPGGKTKSGRGHSGYIIPQAYYENLSLKYFLPKLSKLNVDSPSNSFLEDIQPDILTALIDRISLRGTSQGGDLKQEVVNRYIYKIENILDGHRKIIIKEKGKIYLSTPHGSSPVIAVTRDGGITGVDNLHDIQVSLDGLKPSLSELPLSPELSYSVQNEKLDSDQVIILLDGLIKEAGGLKQYLKNKLSAVILHELTHEIIPNNLFRDSKNSHSEEEKFVLKFTEAITKNQPLPKGLTWGEANGNCDFTPYFIESIERGQGSDNREQVQKNCKESHSQCIELNISQIDGFGEEGRKTTYTVLEKTFNPNDVNSPIIFVGTSEGCELPIPYTFVSDTLKHTH